jgi:hypothetical protein
MKAYKLMRRRKDGTLGSLFINKKQIIPLNVWLSAEIHPTKGYAFRPGWHCTLKPHAPHLKLQGRVWVEVKVTNYSLFERPLSQGGKWVLANEMKVIKICSCIPSGRGATLRA